MLYGEVVHGGQEEFSVRRQRHGWPYGAVYGGGYMFWKSVAHGLGLFAEWQVWVVCLGAALCMLLVITVIALASVGEHDNQPHFRPLVGCLMGGLVQPAMTLATVIIATVVLVPTIFGYGTFLPWVVFRKVFWVAAAWGTAGALLYLILTTIPIIGPVINSGPPVIVLSMISGPIVRGIARSLAAQLPESISGQVVVPGFWAGIGYVAIAILLFYGCMLLMALFHIPLQSRRNRQPGFFEEPDDGDPTVLDTVFDFGLSFAAGLLPAFMTGQYFFLVVSSLPR
jgi:hypothetical protein